jgi:hypothetical protein
MPKTITALFNTRQESESALRKLEQAGFTRDQITMLVSEETRGRHFGIDDNSKAQEGAATGAAIGGLVGALYLSLASAGTLMIPGLNLIVSGALVGALAGLGAGAATGGLVGALVGLGIPEYEAKLYEEAVRKGAILIAVEAASDASAGRIEDILKDTNARNITALAA